MSCWNPNKYKTFNWGTERPFDDKGDESWFQRKEYRKEKKQHSFVPRRNQCVSIPDEDNNDVEDLEMDETENMCFGSDDTHIEDKQSTTHMELVQKQKKLTEYQKQKMYYLHIPKMVNSYKFDLTVNQFLEICLTKKKTLSMFYMTLKTYGEDKMINIYKFVENCLKVRKDLFFYRFFYEEKGSKERITLEFSHSNAVVFFMKVFPFVRKYHKVEFVKISEKQLPEVPTYTISIDESCNIYSVITRLGFTKSKLNLVDGNDEENFQVGCIRKSLKTTLVSNFGFEGMFDMDFCSDIKRIRILFENPLSAVNSMEKYFNVIKYGSEEAKMGFCFNNVY